MSGNVQYDTQGRDVRRPAWLCQCGTTLHPAITQPGSARFDTTAPRCPVCATHGKTSQPRPVTITIDHEGWTP